MGSSAGTSNAAVNVSPSINNGLVTLCVVYHNFGISDLERYLLSAVAVLAVLKGHSFEIKPANIANVPIFLCELREGVPPWPSETLDRAMRDALPGNKSNPPVRWNFS
jgi:hypothetical protein